MAISLSEIHRTRTIQHPSNEERLPGASLWPDWHTFSRVASTAMNAILYDNKVQLSSAVAFNFPYRAISLLFAIKEQKD